jgi:hypothetical protein
LQSQQQVAQKRGPNLPAHRIGAVAEKVGEFEGLLDLLENHLDRPAAAVKVDHGLRAPFHVFGEEFHFAVLPVDLHQGPHAAHAARIFGTAAFVQEKHHVGGE